MSFESIELPDEMATEEPDEVEGPRVTPKPPTVINHTDFEWTQFQPDPPRYWQLVRYESLEIDSHEEPVAGGGNDDPEWRKRPTPIIEPLATRQELLTRLRKATGYRSISHQPDIDEIVKRISACELLDRIPRKPVRVWGSSLHIIQDRSIRLTPYWSDQDFVCRILMSIYPRYALTISRVHEQESTPTSFGHPNDRRSGCIPLKQQP